MTYRIARAAEREWTDSPTVPGLRDAILAAAVPPATRG